MVLFDWAAAAHRELNSSKRRRGRIPDLFDAHTAISQ